MRQTTRGTDNVVIAVAETSYDTMGRPLCSAVRMNPASWGTAPVDACTLTTAGSAGPDRISRTIYDTASRVIRIERAVGTPLQQSYVSYGYTASGQRSEVFDANGNRATYTYDSLDRMVTHLVPQPSPASGILTSTSYDLAGRSTQISDNTGHILAYAYDTAKRPQSVTQTAPGVTGTRVVSGLTGLAISAGTASCTVTVAGLTNQAGQVNASCAAFTCSSVFFSVARVS